MLMPAWKRFEAAFLARHHAVLAGRDDLIGRPLLGVGAVRSVLRIQTRFSAVGACDASRILAIGIRQRLTAAIIIACLLRGEPSQPIGPPACPDRTRP